MLTGLVHIYTGDGKGKTTAAIGLGIRACGNGLKVIMVQFLKGSPTGELAILRKLEPDFLVCRNNDLKGFFWNMNGEQKEELRRFAAETLNYVQNKVSTEEWDLLILDEVMGAISNNLISVREIVDFIKNKPEKLEVVLTGRHAPRELVEIADYVSEINPRKHPLKMGIAARRGIEF
ncbi:MAG TPA: cob(I)yrinic acid a,c-diamide adenosyltransferase [Desulfitobacteriaceae bacterium]|nr:cob(I)yrinic acid a,c-diamide adenosyltransferase [Desulfitobacteriaceae bacterium]